MHSKKSKYTNIVFIILLSIGVFSLASRSTLTVKLLKSFVYYVAYPNVNVANQIFQQSGRLAENIQSMVYYHQENLSYKQANQNLSDKLRNYDVMKAQYDDLVGLLKIPKIQYMQTVFAKVAIREPNEWYQWFIISKGSNDGLYNELPVAMLREDGKICAVGRIVETYKDSAKVALITNVMSVVPVQIRGKNINCLAEGTNSNTLKITYIPFDANIEVGDEITASTLSSVFNEGMPIGVVKTVYKEPTMDFKTATAEILFESSTLYTAIVLVPQQGEQK